MRKIHYEKSFSTKEGKLFFDSVPMSCITSNITEFCWNKHMALTYCIFGIPLYIVALICYFDINRFGSIIYLPLFIVSMFLAVKFQKQFLHILGICFLVLCSGLHIVPLFMSLIVYMVTRFLLRVYSENIQIKKLSCETLGVGCRGYYTKTHVDEDGNTTVSEYVVIEYNGYNMVVDELCNVKYAIQHAGDEAILVRFNHLWRKPTYKLVLLWSK